MLNLTCSRLGGRIYHLDTQRNLPPITASVMQAAGVVQQRHRRSMVRHHQRIDNAGWNPRELRRLGITVSARQLGGSPLLEAGTDSAQWNLLKITSCHGKSMLARHSRV